MLRRASASAGSIETVAALSGGEQTASLSQAAVGKIRPLLFVPYQPAAQSQGAPFARQSAQHHVMVTPNFTLNVLPSEPDENVHQGRQQAAQPANRHAVLSHPTSDPLLMPDSMPAYFQQSMQQIGDLIAVSPLNPRKKRGRRPKPRPLLPAAPNSSLYIDGESEKPVYSYCALIVQAICAAEQRRLTLHDIYEWISKHYPFYRRGDARWENAIRHNLSVQQCFRKIPKEPPSSGSSDDVSGGGERRGAYWSISERLSKQEIETLTVSTSLDGGQSKRRPTANQVRVREERRRVQAAIRRLELQQLQAEQLEEEGGFWDGPLVIDPQMLSCSFTWSTETFAVASVQACGACSVELASFGPELGFL